MPLEEAIVRGNSIRANPFRRSLLLGATVGSHLSQGSGPAVQFLLANLVAGAYTSLHVGCISA